MKILKGSNLYKLVWNTDVVGVNMGTSTKSDDTLIRHMRLGHMSKRGMQDLHKRCPLKKVQNYKLEFYKFSVLGKQQRVHFQTASHESRVILDYIHTDLWGPVDVKSKSGDVYYISFTYDYSREVWIYFLVHKNEAFDKFMVWKQDVEKQQRNRLNA